jgi:hypothetical protein
MLPETSIIFTSTLAPMLTPGSIWTVEEEKTYFGDPTPVGAKPVLSFFRLPVENSALLAKCTSMIDLLLQVGYVLLVLAILSFFFCTLPVWLIVLVVVFLLR